MKKSNTNAKGKTKAQKVGQEKGTSVRLSLAERNSVIADRLAGMTNIEIAAKYHKHEITISRIFSKFRKSASRAEVFQNLGDYKQDLKQRSVNMLKTALAPTNDRKTALKAAPVAVSVLKGVGEFAGDFTAGVSISFEPGALDWAEPKLVGSSATAEATPSALPEKTE